MSFRFLPLVSLCLVIVPLRGVEPLSKSYAIDFFRDIPSRNLKGLATRSDGRLVSGPTLTDLQGPALPQLLWTLEPAEPNHWLLGTGPEGKVIEVTLDSAQMHYTVQDVATLPEQQVLALKRLSDGSILAGTSPDGGLFLIRGHAIAAQILLPVDSVFDITLHGDTAFVATGNPARVYAVDLKRFASAGVEKNRLHDAAALAVKGIKELGQVRDRNIRRLAWAGDKLIAGSSPKGNLYAFSPNGEPPQLLQENREAEVSAILPQADGSFFAALVFATNQADTRINRGNSSKTASDSTPSETTSMSATEKFTGRSSVVYFPSNGFPETTFSRSGVAFYALGLRGSTLLIAGGEQGDVLGYDLVARQTLSYAGSDSAQLNALVSLDHQQTAAPARFLALRNNESGLAVIDFDAVGPQSAETGRLDLGTAARLGALRIARLRSLTPEQVKIDMRTSFGTDEVEGWSPWTQAAPVPDGWLAASVKGREVRLRIQITPTKGNLPELDDATLFYLPQNRRPQLGEFRIAPPNFALLPASESSNASLTLGQLLAAADRDERRKPVLTNNNVITAPGNQLVFWNVTDADGDTVACTFSICRDGSDQWQDIVVGTKDSFVQFNTSHFADGVYLTRLVAEEHSPRPIAERLTTTFATDELIIDHTPPTITDLNFKRNGDTLTVTVSGHDDLSLLENAEFIFNNGDHEIVAQPADGIRDSQTETFVLEIPTSKVAGANSVQVLLSDAADNTSARTIDLPR